MPLRLRPTLMLACAMASTPAAAAPETAPSFEPVRAEKPRQAAIEIAPAPVSYGLEASLDAGGRVAIRCRAGESATYLRWRAAFDARQREGVER